MLTRFQFLSSFFIFPSAKTLEKKPKEIYLNEQKNWKLYKELQKDGFIKWLNEECNYTFVQNQISYVTPDGFFRTHVHQFASYFPKEPYGNYSPKMLNFLARYNNASFEDGYNYLQHQLNIKKS